MILQALYVLLLLQLGLAEDESTPATLVQSAATTTLGALYRQARSEHFYNGRYVEQVQPSRPIPAAAAAVERDAAYYESRCLTCDPNKSANNGPEREAYVAPAPRWRQRIKYDYYDEDLEDRRFARDRYENYDRARLPAYDYDRYDPYVRNELFRPLPQSDRYEQQPYDRERYYDRPAADPYALGRPAERPLERPVDRPMERPAERPYDRAYDRGNGYDNLDPRYPYDDRYDRYNPPPARRPQEDAYGPPIRYTNDRYNNRAYSGRYDSRYDPYERASGWRRPYYDDRYDRYDPRYPPPPPQASDGRGYYAAGAWGPGYERGYASAWNYGGPSRDNWRDVPNNRDRDRGRDRDRDRDREPERERDRERDRDHDSGFYRPRDYFYDSTAAPGGSRGTSYLYDRPESSTKPDVDRDKPTNSPQTQDGKNYKD